MATCSHSLWLSVLVLAACSSAGTMPEKDGPSPATAPSPLAFPASADLPAEQRTYFEDGKVTLAEYQEAYAAFAQCAADAGIGGDLREQGRDEVTGLIIYSTQTLLLPPGQSDGTQLNECYHRRFAHVEMAFQASDPAVLAAGTEDQMVFFNEEFRPCLEKIGVAVPDDLEVNDENWAQLFDEAARALQDGRCDSA